MTFRARDYFQLAALNPEDCGLRHEYMSPLLIASGFARSAGALLMGYYGKKIDVVLKDADQTPVTVADQKSSAFLVTRLGTISPSIPVVSEENDDPGAATYWAVDPLDGTKEFIDRTKGFCVKIALIHDLEPVVGIVFCPAQNVLYAAVKGGPAVKIGPDRVMERITTRSVMESRTLKTLFNKKHADPAEYKARRAEFAAKGIALAARPLVRPGLPRNLQVAEGLADVHVGCGFGSGPLVGSGYVWDAAPDDLILTRAGGCMVNYDGSKLDYSQPRERMPGYLALGDPALRTKLHP